MVGVAIREHPAFEVLLNAFEAANPDIEVIDGAIAGGGSNVQVALAARLRAGDAARCRDLSSQGVGVPTASHRGNVVWFNQRVLRGAGVAVPGPGNTPEAFASELAKVTASGRTALCHGSASVRRSFEGEVARHEVVVANGDYLGGLE